MNKRTLSDQAFDFALLSLIALTPLILSFEFTFVAYYPKLLTFHMGLALLYLIWILQNPPRKHVSTSSLFLPILLSLILDILSSLQAVNRIEFIFQLSHHVAFPLFFWALINHIKTPDITRYLSCAVGVGILSAIIGMIQYAGWGLFWIPSVGFPSGTLGYRNYAATYTILCIPLGLMRFIESRRPFSAWFWGMGTAVLITFLFCTRTRGAWVGITLSFLCALMAAFFVKTHDKRPLYHIFLQTLSRQHLTPTIAGFIVIVGFLNAVPPNMQGRGFDRNRADKAHIMDSAISIFDRSLDEGKSVYDRLHMWQNSVELITDHPIFGVGLGNWQYVYPAYDNGDVIWEGATPKRPHNDYIWIATELGIPGLLIHLWLLGTLFVCIHRQIGTLNRSRVLMPVFIGISLLAMFTEALFNFPRERIEISVIMYLLIACIALYDTETRPHHPFDKPLRFVGLAILVLCIIIDLRAIRFDQHFYRALHAQQKNDYHLVVRETTAAIQNGIVDPQILLIRGVAHAYLNNFSQALADNQKCLEYHPYFLNGLNNMGLLYNGIQQYQKAHEVLLRALKIDPDHADAHANLGIAYQGLGHLEASVVSLEKAFSRDSTHVDIRTYLGKAYYSLAEARRTQADTAGARASYTAFLTIWQGDAHSADVVRSRLQMLQKP